MELKKDRRFDSMGAAHEGIKTVAIEKVCEFSTSSVTCVCIVTWNMNGKVDKGFDLVDRAKAPIYSRFTLDSQPHVGLFQGILGRHGGAHRLAQKV